MARLSPARHIVRAAVRRHGLTTSASIHCVWLEPVARFELSLRRFTFSLGADGICHASSLGYHNASAVLGQAGIERCPMVREGQPVHGDNWPHDDGRWPATCACGYTFVLGDEWQFNPDQLFRRSDTGELVTLSAAPAGAMYDAHWMGELSSYKRVEGITLVVKTPAGEWCVDGPSYAEGKVSGRGWTRSGKVPNITAKPDVYFPNGYRGRLVAGRLMRDNQCI